MLNLVAFKITALLAVVAMLTVMLFIAAPKVEGQEATRQIQRGLCAGANLDFNNAQRYNCQQSDALTRLNRIVRRVVNLLSVIVGVVAVIMIIIGGLRYVTSAGNDAGVQAAKKTLLYAIIGLLIVAFAQVIVHFVLTTARSGGSSPAQSGSSGSQSSPSSRPNIPRGTGIE